MCSATRCLRADAGNRDDIAALRRCGGGTVTESDTQGLTHLAMNDRPSGAGFDAGVAEHREMPIGIRVEWHNPA